MPYFTYLRSIQSKYQIEMVLHTLSPGTSIIFPLGSILFICVCPLVSKFTIPILPKIFLHQRLFHQFQLFKALLYSLLLLVYTLHKSGELILKRN